MKRLIGALDAAFGYALLAAWWCIYGMIRVEVMLRQAYRRWMDS